MKGKGTTRAWAGRRRHSGAGKPSWENRVKRKRAEKAALAQLCLSPPGLVQALFPNHPQTLRSSDGAGKTLWRRWPNLAPDQHPQASIRPGPCGALPPGQPGTT